MVKAAGAKADNLPPSYAVVTKSGNLISWNLYLFTLYIGRCKIWVNIWEIACKK